MIERVFMKMKAAASKFDVTEKEMKSLAAIVALGLLLSGCEKTRLDDQIRELCAKDGGVKVYEQIKLPADAFDERRVPSFYKPTAGENALGPEYIFKENKQYYRKGNPEMWRTHREIVRRSDSKVLSEETIYIRRGGDGPIPLPMHDSSFICPSAKDRGLIEKTFVKSNQG